MSIGYCNHTTCFRSDNLDLIEQAITSILEQEGYYFIPQPALPKNDLPVMQVLRSLYWKVTPYLGMVGLFPGNLGWTLVKAQPPELLCQRARGAAQPRLAELAIQSGCDGFHYRIYDFMNQEFDELSLADDLEPEASLSAYQEKWKSCMFNRANLSSKSSRHCKN